MILKFASVRFLKSVEMSNEENAKQPESFASIGKVEAVRRMYAESPFSYCNVLSMPSSSSGKAVRSSSVLFLEGTDFDLVYTPLKHLGYKSTLAALGELYVKMALPYAMAVRLGVSAKLDFPQVCELWSGVVAAAKEHGVKAVSLDLQPSKNGLAISVSAFGSVPSELKEPEAPRSMDLICVSDNLGSAYMGLHVLEREKAAFNASSDKDRQPELAKYEYLLKAYLRPEIKGGIVKEFEEAGFVPSCGYFVRNGLADAVKRLSSDTGLGAKIYLDRIPIADKVFEMAEEIGMDPVAAALNGGDDFRYLFTIPIGRHDAFRRDFQTFDVIGHLAKPEAGAVIVTPEGAELPLHAQGW